jgi:poly-gamma-glutamate synthesis protein (capsule biosynthesis protein)
MRTDRDKRRLPAFLLVVSLIAGLLTGCVVTFEPVEEVQSVTTQPTTLPEPTETEPEPTEPPTEPVPPVTTTATITVTGDLLMHIPVINSAKEGKSWNFKPIFRYIEPYVQSADYAVANLETTLCGTDNGYKYQGWPNFNCPDNIATDTFAVGFDMLLTANNHCHDTKVVGLNRTLDVLTETGIASLGTRHTPEDPDYAVVEINGIKIGMTAFTYEGDDGDPNTVNINGNPCSAQAAGMINSFDYTNLDAFYTRLQGQIDGMRAQGAEAIVVFLHWGWEYFRNPNEQQRTIAQALCDMGVDVIVGGHPHVLQPVDLLTSTTDPSRTTLCIYSTGNALSNQRLGKLKECSTAHTEDGILFTFTFAKYSDGTVAVQSTSAIPTWLNLTSSPRQYIIIPLVESEMDNWQTQFSLTNGAYTACKDSFDRTMAIIGEGMEKAQTYYASADAAKQTALESGH